MTDYCHVCKKTFKEGAENHRFCVTKNDFLRVEPQELDGLKAESDTLLGLTIAVFTLLILFGFISLFLEFRDTKTLECSGLRNRDQVRARWDKTCKLVDFYKTDHCLDLLTCAWRRM